MPTYQEIYPSPPLLRSDDQVRRTARDLISLEYFEADPDKMPTQIFDQHHILINLKNEELRVVNWREGRKRDFIFRKNEIVITPAGVESGWRWHEPSKCLVITIQPKKLEDFVQTELGLILGKQQLLNIPQEEEEDIASAAVLVLEALRQGGSASDVMFESLARIFLVKLVTKYGLIRDEGYEYMPSFTAKHYKKVLDHVAQNFGQPLQVDDLAKEVGISTAHFSRLFKQVIGEAPYKFLTRYRVEQAAKMLAETNQPIATVADRCGFSDQAHLTRLFKKYLKTTPKSWRLID